MKIDFTTRNFVSIPARATSVTSVKDRYKVLQGWEFQCWSCQFSTTFPDDEYENAVAFRMTHRCYSKYDPNRRVTMARTSAIHSSSEGTGRA